MLFHVVPSDLFSMVAFSTMFLLVEVIQQPIRIIEIGGYWSCHGEQIEGYHMKEDKNMYQKLVSIMTLPCILFGAIYQENKQCISPVLTYSTIDKNVTADSIDLRRIKTE